MFRNGFACFAAAFSLAVCPLSAHTQLAPPNALNFQGRLATPSGNPVPDGNYNIRFRFYDANTGSILLYEYNTFNAPVRNGVVAVKIDGFTPDKFNGNAWVALSINGGADLAPRTQIVSVPYALKSTLALTVPDGSITNAKLAGGITADKFAANIFNPIAWLLGGNSGVTSGFLGTTDNQPLEFRVNGRRAMRYQYVENSEFRSINVLGGSELNTIAAGVIGATIAGGGRDAFIGEDFPNRVSADFGTIGGGYLNAASGGNATIGGGAYNLAIGNQATIGGGYINFARGDYATIGGGIRNKASGNFSFAAGQRATATHDGAFVWNDASDVNSEFASTAANQFLIHATGGVGINKTNPVVGAFDVNGTAQMTGFKLPTGAGAGKVLTSDATGGGTWQSLSLEGITAGGGLGGTYPNPTISANAVSSTKLASEAASLSKVSGSAMTSSGGNIGVGTASPKGKLHVNGDYYGKGHVWLYALEGDGTNGTAYIQARDDSTTSNVGMQLRTKQGSTVQDVMRLTPGGSVGIGTASPLARLQVNTGGGTGASLKLEHSGSNFIVRPSSAGSTQTVIENSAGGGIYCNSHLTTVGFTNLSDARFKKEIADLPYALDALLNLHGVSYEWDTAKFPDKSFDKGKQLGFLAQEVEQTLPELVQTDKQGYKSVNYIGILPVAVEAIKAQQSQIETLKVKNAALEAKLAALTEAVAQLKAQRK